MIFKVAAVLVISFALALFVPVFSDEARSYLVTPIPLVVTFSLLVTFFINSARERLGSLKKSIALELSRTRRVAHITRALIAKDKNFEEWGQGILTDLMYYFDSFSHKDIQQYPTGDGVFRRVTSYIYYFPKTNDPHVLAIYQELLDTTREWALVREQIKGGLRGRLALYHWAIIGVGGLLVIATLLFIRFDALPSKLVSGSAIGAVLLTVELLQDVDYLSKKERSDFAELYLKNKELC